MADTSNFHKFLHTVLPLEIIEKREIMFQPKDSLYLLRWRFDFADRPSRIGMWSQSGTRDEDKASFVNTTGLVRASIEGKDVVTREVKALAECDGHDYVVFKWNAAFISTGSFAAGQHVLTGLKLVTRDLELDVFPSGDVKISARLEDEKNFNYAAFGK
ncbi:hypothetical protein UFOVP901_26 [uncultured Caudovirales phage]|uniref:Uncharacterized protein n=1 Tax=uncultured Caudovirales phage TaxID=2100421 RepID=A0A6J5PFT6_9CAUD|nr:hypothetical protein UFOVP901_26 [uncultured Caudovirales phage]